MIAIRQPGRGRRLLGAHAGHLLVGEAVELEVRQAPVGVAEVRTRERGGAIGLDRLGDPADGLQRMAHPERDVPGGRRLLKHGSVDAEGLLVLSKTDGGGGGQGAIGGVGRIDGEQLVDLLGGRPMLLPLDQRLGIVVARRAIVGD